MKRNSVRIVMMLFVFLAGLGIAALGLGKPDASASGLTPDAFAFGPSDSTRTVYIVSDWFCPACQAAEPEIIKGARLAMKQAKVFFVDYPVHPETLNYIPYNLSFMVREKGKYLQIRESLGALARKTKDPSPEDVQMAVSPLGLKYTPLNFSDILAGTQFQIATVKKFGIRGTPEVVVTDSRTGKTRTLHGIKEITSDNILKALAEVSEK